MGRNGGYRSDKHRIKQRLPAPILVQIGTLFIYSAYQSYIQLSTFVTDSPVLHPSMKEGE